MIVFRPNMFLTSLISDKMWNLRKSQTPSKKNEADPLWCQFKNRCVTAFFFAVSVNAIPFILRSTGVLSNPEFSAVRK